MSTTVDSKVVEMSFDNKDFESNVKTSMSTLDKLKEALKFDNIVDGFNNISRAANKTDISVLANAAEAVSVKFDAMNVIAITALTNITNAAINTGEQLIKSLSVDNIAAGFEKFGNKTVSVGTLVSQGYDIDTVTEQLERLNWFTDETSYNFTDMVSNIAKFTATGQDLQPAVSAMEGIANWAALSGQNAQVASSAMYQLAQAMGAGVMRLEDYKSIQNASMDTDEFRQKALDAAVALGTLKKNADGTYQSLTGGSSEAFTKQGFTTMLTEGKWFTSGVMMKVFTDYSQAVNEIMAYSEREGMTASEVISNIYDTAEDDGISVDEVIKKMGLSFDEFSLKALQAAQEARTWGDVIDSVQDAVSTGWMNTFENIFGNYEEAKQLWTNLANELYDVFAEGGNQRNAVLSDWKDFGGRTELLEAFWNAFHALTDVINLVKEAISDIIPQPTATQLFQFSKNLRLLTENFEMSEETAERLKSVLHGAASVFDFFGRVIFSIAKGIVVPLVDAFGDLGESLLIMLAPVGEAISKFDRLGETLGFFDLITYEVANAVSILAYYISRLVANNINDFLYGFSKNGSVLTGILYAIIGNIGNLIRMIFTFVSAITGIDFSGLQTKVLNTFSIIFNIVSSGFTGIYNFIKAIFSNFAGIPVDNLFSAVLDALKTGFDAIKRLIEGMNGTSASSIKGLNGFMEAIKAAFNALLGSDFSAIKNLANGIKEVFVSLVNSINSPDFKTVLEIIRSGAFVAISVGIQKITDAITGAPGNLISNFFDSIKDGLFGDVREGAVSVFEKLGDVLGSYDQKIKTDQLRGIAISVGILAGSLFLLSTIDAEHMASGITGLASVIGGLILTFSALNKMSLGTGIGNIVRLAIAALLLSSAVLKLTGALIALSRLNPQELVNGLLGIGGALGILIVAAKILTTGTFSKDLGIVAASLATVAFALNLLIPPMIIFGSMPIENIGKGMFAIVGTVALLSEVLKGMTSGLKNVGELIVMAVAINMLTIPLALLGAMPIENIGKGIFAIVGTMALLSTILANMTSGLKNVAGLILMAAAINMLVIPLAILGTMPIENIGKGMFAIIGTVALLSVVLAQLKGSIVAVSSLILMAAALNMLVAPMVILGAMPIENIGKGIFALAGTIAIIGTLLSGLSTAVTGVFVLIAMTAAMNALIPVVLAFGSLRLDQIGSMILAFVAVIGVLVGGLALISALSGFLAPAIPIIWQAVAAIMGFALGLNLLAPPLVALGILGVQVVHDIIDAIHIFAENSTQLKEDLTILLEDLTELILNVAGAILLGLLESLHKFVGPLIELVLEICIDILKAIDDFAVPLVDIIVKVIVDITEAIANKVGDIVQAVIDILIAVIDGLTESLENPENWARLRESLLGFLKGMFDATLAFFGINSPSTKMAWVGQMIIEGLRDGIVGAAMMVFDAIAAIFQFISEFINKDIQAFKARFDMGWDMIREYMAEGYKMIKDKFSEVIHLGENLVTGLIKGITNAKDKAVESVKKLGTDVVDKLKDVLKIHSPSEITEYLGKMFSGGFGLGIEDGVGGVKSAASNLGTEALSTLSGTLDGAYEDGYGYGFSWATGYDDGRKTYFNKKDFGLTDWGDYYRTYETARDKRFRESQAGKSNPLADFSNFDTPLFTDDSKSKSKSKKTKSASNAYEKATKELRDKSIKAYKELFELYEKGKITRIEYETKYTQILKDAMWTRADVVQEATESMEKYATDKIKEINKTYEKELSEIQKNIDKFADSMAGDFKDAFTFTDVKAEVEKFSDKVNGDFKDIFQFKTNKDIYDEKVKDFDDQITKLEEKQKKYAEMYGEQSDWAQSVQREIDKVKKAEEDYKKEYAESGKDDSKIVEVSFKDKLKKETMDLQAYRIGLEKLKKKGLSDSLRDTIAEMSQEEGIAFVRYLNSLTDEEFKAIEAQWALKQKESEKLGKSLYGDKDTDISFNNTLEQETKDLEEYLGELKKLRARGMSDILKETIAGMSQEEGLKYVKYLNSLSDEAFAAIEQQWKDKTDMAKELGEFLYEDDIKDATSKYKGDITNTLADLPDSAREIGMNTARSLAEGFSEEALETLDIINGSVDAIIERAIKTVPVIDRVSIGKEQMSADYNALLKEKYGTTIIPGLGTSLAYRPTLNTTQNTRSVSQINVSPSSFASVNASMNTNTKELTKLSKTVDRGFNNLGDRIGCMAIVMDRNSLADGLASPINDRIGRIIVRKGRGG